MASALKLLKRKLGDSPWFAETFVAAQQLGQSWRRPRLVMLLDAMHSGSGGDLRGRALAPGLRELGWRVILVPPSMNLAQRRRVLAVESPDVILLRQSRHPLNRPALYAPVPCVFDADDADIDYQPGEVLGCLRGSVAVVAGSRRMAEVFRQHNSQVSVIWTGTYASQPAAAAANEKRHPVITWAHSVPSLFPGERALLREVLLRLAARHKFQFHLYGQKETEPDALGDLRDPLAQAGVGVKVFGLLPYRQFIESLGQAAIGLNPVCMDNGWSRGKSFGKVLAYIAAGAAVITSPELDYPLFFRDRENGCFAGSVEEWVESCSHLLEHPQERGRIARQAAADMACRLSSTRAAQLLDGVLRDALRGASGARREEIP